MAKKTVKASDPARYDELKKMLVERQREILSEVQGKIREVRIEGAEKPRKSHHQEETPDVDIQEDIEFAIIQMKAETLNKINDALSRLEDGTYGHCFECSEEIAQPRLRALPFAARCKDCQEARENAEQRERQLSGRRGVGMTLFDW